MTTPPALRRDGAEILDDVRDALSRYCILPSRHAYTAVTLFCAYTHAAAVFDFAPRLVLTSPEKRSGKTRCLEIIHQLAHKPLSTANASTAALYRSLAEPRTVLLDEADTIFGTRLKAEQHDDLRGLLNAGFQRGTPVVRWDASKRELEQLHTFAPVVLAAIGRLPDTITDRGINIAMRRRKPAEGSSRSASLATPSRCGHWRTSCACGSRTTPPPSSAPDQTCPSSTAPPTCGNP